MVAENPSYSLEVDIRIYMILCASNRKLIGIVSWVERAGPCNASLQLFINGILNNCFLGGPVSWGVSDMPPTWKLIGRVAAKVDQLHR